MNEVRLIDANALPVQTAFEDEEGRPYQFVQALDIDAAPTIDPVEVVRCAECDEFDDGTCKLLRLRREDNDFCSYGARMDAEEDGTK